MEEIFIKNLRYLTKEYEEITKNSVRAQNRLAALEIDKKYCDIYKKLESIKGNIERRIRKELEAWPIWNLWMSDIKGLGGFIAAKLINFYYYRFTAVCPKCEDILERKDNTLWCERCGKSVKGEGNLRFKIEIKDFPKISSWWHYLGMHNPNGGKKAKRKKGEQSDWSQDAQRVCFLIGEQFIKQVNSLYREHYLRVKSKKDRTHPDATKMHKHNMARHETAKLFASHFWMVAREIEGLEVTIPYSATLLGHENVIKPFYWEPQSV
ncbi:hypothetical protein KAR91_42790 [Candidatus Pacearchaeota archaeon]|nr:hypothetical protein [Candidatus Pacearchaeota archaeon]